MRYRRRFRSRRRRVSFRRRGRAGKRRMRPLRIGYRFG